VGCFLKAEIHLFWLPFSTVKVMHLSLDKKISCATFWAIFSQTHLVALILMKDTRNFWRESSVQVFETRVINFTTDGNYTIKYPSLLHMCDGKTFIKFILQIIVSNILLIIESSKIITRNKFQSWERCYYIEQMLNRDNQVCVPFDHLFLRKVITFWGWPLVHSNKKSIPRIMNATLVKPKRRDGVFIRAVISMREIRR
jgi:hypothetical protein